MYNQREVRKNATKCSAMAGSEGYEHEVKSNVAEKLTELSYAGLSLPTLIAV